MNQLKIGCIIMASGDSKRFGSNKLLQPFHNKPLFQHIVETTDCDCFAKRLVLTRTREIADYCMEHGISSLLHAFPLRNQVIQLGISQMEDMDACIFCLGDQPLLKIESLIHLVDAFSKQGAGIYRLSWHGEAKSPVLFSRDYFQDLINLPDKKGGGYLAVIYPDAVKMVEAETELEILDIDTPEDLFDLELKTTEL